MEEGNKVVHLNFQTGAKVGEAAKKEAVVKVPPVVADLSRACVDGAMYLDWIAAELNDTHARKAAGVMWEAVENLENVYAVDNDYEL